MYDPPSHLINPELIALAQLALGERTKRAFIPAQGGDPGAGGMPPGMPPGMDPAMMGAPPPGMDPSGGGGGGGAPPFPAPPSGGGGGGGAEIMMQQIMQKLDGLGGAGGGAGIKPKIDVNVALMQISKMLARIADALGVQIPAHEMIATPQDLGAMAQQQTTGAPGGGGMSGGGQGAIPPIQPMEGMQPAGMPGGEKTSFAHNGHAFDSSGLISQHNRATAIKQILAQRGKR